MIVAAAPWLAVAVLAGAGAAWLGARRGWSAARRGLAAAAAVALGCVPAGLALPGPGGAVRLIVWDRSGSVGDRADAAFAALVRLATVGNGRVGVVVVGRGAAVARLPATGAPDPATIPVPEPDGTDLAGALRLARTMAPAGGAEVVCATDGRATGDPDALADAVRALAARGVRVHVVPTGRPPGADAAVVGLGLPAAAPPGARVSGRAIVRCAADGEARVRVRAEGVVVLERSLAGDPGEVREVPFALTMPGEGSVRVRATAAAATDADAPDAVPENGARESLVAVSGPPMLLAISATPDTVPVARLLTGDEAWRLRAVTPDLAPATADGLAGVAVVVLEDAPAAALGPARLAALAAWVEGGGTLVQIGGPGGFLAGGYGGDPLERVAAVRADPRAERPLALALALDVSGSMAEPAAAGDAAAGTRLDAARDAVRAVWRTLRPGDTVLWIPFREGLVHPPLVVTDGPETDAALRGLEPGGGTRLRPALEAAAAWLAGRTEPARACAVISDGRDPALAAGGADRDAVAAALRAIVGGGATPAAICAGPAPDLRALVTEAGGRLADLDDFRGLRDLLTRELRDLRADPDWHGPATPVATGAGRAALGAGGAPAVLRASRTVAAPEAETWLALPDGPPLLAVRRAGLGRSLAFTTSPRPGFAPEWAGASGRGLLRRALDATSPRRQVADIEARVAATRDGLRVDVRWTGHPPADGRALALVDGARRVALAPAGPGSYAADLPDAPAARLATLVEGERVLALLGLPGAPAPEWDAVGADRAACERLARLGGGRVIADAALWQPDATRGAAPRRLDGWWLALALMCALAAFGARGGGRGAGLRVEG